jgi:hypothetical protein
LTAESGKAEKPEKRKLKGENEQNERQGKKEDKLNGENGRLTEMCGKVEEGKKKNLKEKEEGNWKYER